MGLGEVGGPLRDLLQCDGYDPAVPPYTAQPEGVYDVLHVAIPWSWRFIDSVTAACFEWLPKLTIIHSTVPIGTTAQFGDTAVHSPILGRHDQMSEDLLRQTKWVGGFESRKAAAIFEAVGMECKTLPFPEHTEALKLICLMKYGVTNAVARYADELAGKIGLSPLALRHWDMQYNETVRDSELRRSLLVPDGAKIGGHCVVPGTKLLGEFAWHPLIEAVLRYG